MAGEHNSSGSRGESLIAEIGKDTRPGTTCSFHAFSGDGPCPYCIEAGADVRISTALAFDQSTKSFRIPGRRAWIDDCPNCASTDIRRCVAIMQDFAWCGACGARDGQ